MGIYCHFKICFYAFFVFIFNGVFASALNIVLDPGHGCKGNDPGCVREYDGKEVMEAGINFKIASFLKDELEKYETKKKEKVNVFITKSRDENPKLIERVEFGKREKADFLVSLHVNSISGENKDIRGAMVLVTYSNFNNLKEKEEKMAQFILSELEKIGVNIRRPETKTETLDPGSPRLSNGLLYRTSNDSSEYENGDITDWYGIVREGVNKKLPSIIVEHAYLDNEEDYREFLSSDEKIKNLALADARGIANYYGLNLKGSKDSEDSKTTKSSNKAIGKIKNIDVKYLKNELKSVEKNKNEELLSRKIIETKKLQR